MTAPYRVDLLHGGYILAHHVAESHSGKALVLRLGECDCYKSDCDCVVTLAVPKRIVSRWGAVPRPKEE